MTAALDADVTTLPGVGPVLAGHLLDDLAIATVGDLLRHWPREHKDMGRLHAPSSAPVGEVATLVGTVESWSVRRVPGRGGRGRPLQIAEATVATATGERFTATFFNQPHRTRTLPSGATAAFSGRVASWRGGVQLKSPKTEPVEDRTADALDNRLVPAYPGTERLTSGRLETLVDTALDAAGPLVEWQDDVVLARHGLLGFDEAVRTMHHPSDRSALGAARRRLAFDELFVLQLGLQWRRARFEAELRGLDNGPSGAEGWAARFLAGLPFAPTGAQDRAMADLGADLAGPVPMHRLLQGDVGSGKTLVATWTMLCAVDRGRQAALLAPTEVLAGQHHRTLLAQLEPLGVNLFDGLRVELLTGSTTLTEQRRILGGVLSGEVDVLVGTHAMLEERVRFADLGVVVIDEQHRFGVDQRAALRDKRDGSTDAGTLPDVLVMTATPIPRSLALTVYGDLDVTVLDELPPGRQPITTQLITPDQRERRRRLEDFVRERAALGEQAYWVCPLVDESDAIDATAAVATHARLAEEVFPELEVELVHGQLSSADKERAMQRFRSGEAAVLVATTVVEVGVDVPSATVMVVEDAERFGISQLHQLRGRVGRGGARSYCVLFAGWNAELGEDAERRLTAVAATSDGFELAERDLEVRGAGTLFGSRQSGLPDLRLARLTDLDLVAATRTEARAVVADDPELSDRPGLRREVLRRYDGLEAFAALTSG